MTWLLIFVLLFSVGALTQTQLDTNGYAPIYVGAVAPSNPTSGTRFTGLGQLWYDTTAGSFKVCTTAGGSVCSVWSAVGGGTGGLPTGAIVFITSGSCPAGTTEAVDLDGQLIQATTAAHGDVGTTGGANSITPTVASLSAAAQTFTGASTTVPAEVFTGSSTTVPAETFTGSATTVPALAAGTLVHAHTHTFTASSNAASPKLMTANTSSGVAASGTTGAASSTAITGSTATGTLTPLGSNASTTLTPLGSNASTTITPLGSNSTSAVTGTLNAFDPHPQFTKAIPCRAN